MPEPIERRVQLTAQRNLVRSDPTREGSILAEVLGVSVESKDASGEPAWARNVLRSPPLAPSHKSSEYRRAEHGLLWHVEPVTGLPFARVPGAAVVALDLDDEQCVEDLDAPNIRRARAALRAVGLGPLELGVIALGGSPRVDEELANTLAEDRIVFADEEVVHGSASAKERAERYIARFLDGRRRQRENFARYVERVRLGK